MKKFPLEQLRAVRALRLKSALRALREARAVLETAEAARAEAQQRLHAAHAHRTAYRDEWLQEMSQAAHDAGWIKRHERHLLLLDADIAQLQQRLAQAEGDVARAQAGVDAALAECRHLRAKADALDSYRADWKARRITEQERKDERASEELRLSPRTTTG